MHVLRLQVAPIKYPLRTRDYQEACNRSAPTKQKWNVGFLHHSRVEPVRRVRHHVLHCPLEMRHRRPTARKSDVAAEVVSVVAAQVARSTRYATLNGHSIAHFEIHTRANCDHFASCFMTEAQRLFDLDSAVLSMLIVVHIRTTEGCRLDSYPCVIRFQARKWSCFCY
jgi:hypothetical protein